MIEESLRSLTGGDELELRSAAKGHGAIYCILKERGTPGGFMDEPGGQQYYLFKTFIKYRGKQELQEHDIPSVGLCMLLSDTAGANRAENVGWRLFVAS